MIYTHTYYLFNSMKAGQTLAKDSGEEKNALEFKEVSPM